ncbi:MAG TPA: hypothetical protein VGG69_11870 [Rhizomicrobium sp.]
MFNEMRDVKKCSWLNLRVTENIDVFSWPASAVPVQFCEQRSIRSQRQSIELRCAVGYDGQPCDVLLGGFERLRLRASDQQQRKQYRVANHYAARA